jgi:formylglycine-generating enzyme required for sulfatase activity
MIKQGQNPKTEEKPLTKKKTWMMAAVLLAATAGLAPAQSPVMVRIQGGAFRMGSPAKEIRDWVKDDTHQVTVGSFFLGKYEVTQKEWRAVMGTTLRQQYEKRYRYGSMKDKEVTYFTGISGEGDNYPMYLVNWYDAVEYCNALSRKEGLTPAYTINKNSWDPSNASDRDDMGWEVTWNRSANGYRLPTEAEWEYACRAGTTTPWSTGIRITRNHANYSNDGLGTTTQITPVGSFTPNPWGLYDMHGNVWEWCWDWFGDYNHNAQTDPAGAVSGSRRVLRGGTYTDSDFYMRSAYRSLGTPSSRYNLRGFRVARNGG